MDWLQGTHGMRQFIPAGLCGGAITALLAAAEDPRVVGLLGLGMPVILDGEGNEFWRYMTTEQLKGTRHRYLSKFRVWDPKVWRSWWRFVSFQSHYSLIHKAVLLRKKKPAATPAGTGDGAGAEPAAPADNTNPHFAPAFLKLLAARTPILLAFGGADRLRWEFDEKFVARHGAALAAAPDACTVVITPDANHIFSLGEWQRDVLDHCAAWLARFA
jgi:acetyl esterase/lipase